MKFLKEWEDVLNNVLQPVDSEILESLFCKQLKHSHQIKSALGLYDNAIVHQGAERSYAHLANRRRDMNREQLEKSRRDRAYT